TEPMADLPLTAFDVAVLLIVGLSVLISLMRGVTQDVLITASWVGAGVITYYGFGHARGLARQTIETGLLADAAAFGLVFIVPLVGFKLLAAAIADRLPDGRIGALERVGAMVFGVARGAVIVSVAYLFLPVVWDRDEQPDWIREAMVLPYVQDGAELLQPFVPQSIAERIRGGAEAARRHGETLGELGRSAAELTTE
ncbi:MAG TPA: CvpA family protein, partial [Geminicoccaceae bacterium]|nr:CvpA family protein [Geminicoccaceae bacterium]